MIIRFNAVSQTLHSSQSLVIRRTYQHKTIGKPESEQSFVVIQCEFMEFKFPSTSISRTILSELL